MLIFNIHTCLMQYDGNLSPFNLVAYPHRLHQGIGNNLSSSNNDKVSKDGSMGNRWKEPCYMDLHFNYKKEA